MQNRGLLLALLAAFATASGSVAAKRWPPQRVRIVMTAWQLDMGGLARLLVSLAIGEVIQTAWPQCQWQHTTASGSSNCAATLPDRRCRTNRCNSTPLGKWS
jgi:hypothetical protein